MKNGWMDEDRSESVQSHDEKAELANFIKLATRAFKRDDEDTPDDR